MRTNDAAGTTQCKSQAQLSEYSKKRSAHDLLDSPPLSQVQSYFDLIRQIISFCCCIEMHVGRVATSKRPFESHVQTINRIRTTKPHWTLYGDDILLLLLIAAICQTRLPIQKCRQRNMTSPQLSVHFQVDLVLNLINCQEAGHALVMVITALINLLLHGWCPSKVTTVLFGGKLLAMKEKSDDVRAIAAGNGSNIIRLQTVTLFHVLKTSCCLFS
jgi:hypothetical protein